MSERSIAMGDHNLNPFNHIKREESTPSSFAAPPCSADERLQSLKREGWKGTWMAVVLRKGDEVAVVFVDGTYFRGNLVANPPNEKGQR